MRTIRDHAFLKSDYPVVLSIEDHCSLVQQRKMAAIFQVSSQWRSNRIWSRKYLIFIIFWSSNKTTVQGDWWSHTWVGLTMIFSFLCQPTSAWADGNLAEKAGQQGQVVEQTKSESTQPWYATTRVFAVKEGIFLTSSDSEMAK